MGECGTTKVQRANRTKKAPWHWDEIHQTAFDQVKATIVQDVVLVYPDFSKPFEIYTDASERQLGIVITQKNRPLDFNSRKLSDTQKTIQCYQERTSSHCQRTKGIQRNALGARNCSLY